jgi:AcrR family transcriptional regulator
MKNTDRRVIRTRRLLGEALIDLSLEKGFDDISIQEITNHADVGYRTFFRHYENKEDLLNDVLKGILQEVLKLMAPRIADNSSHKDFVVIPAKNITFLFEHAKANCNLYKVLLDSRSGLWETIMDFAYQAAIVNMQKSPRHSLPIEIVANHLVSSLISMIRWWLECEMPYSPDQMGAYANQLILNPSMNAIEQDERIN